jgi:hypothetical protein
MASLLVVEDVGHTLQQSRVDGCGFISGAILKDTAAAEEPEDSEYDSEGDDEDKTCNG